MALILKRASASRPSGEWSEDDFDVLTDNAVVGRIFKVHAAPQGTPWMWTLAFGHHEDRTPTHGVSCIIVWMAARKWVGGPHVNSEPEISIQPAEARLPAAAIAVN
jgi:hypothetical protein